MPVPTTPPAWRRCWPLTLVVTVFGACVFVPFCLFAAIQIDAGYWFLLRNVAGAGARPALAQASGDAAAPQDTDAGAGVFASNGCAACHSLKPGVTLVGPSLADVADRAGSTVTGLSAEAYLAQAIREPDAHVVDGFPSHVMPDDFGDRLTDAEIDALIAYLLAQ